ncbi:uncharacterized protein Aud_004483 [Aspergillus udagawae]|uniref:Uncharacterized protein n=1 Tax=Aspergillus udagawae TaxID=91492 RepID=A0A8E0UW60_9EURO|nr:uncharacterized protein Aud_004483 [Aspergillus udagawae]GIC88092.1 hypothetical protein Aud_004483 [Aspergillus udagawae]
MASATNATNPAPPVPQNGERNKRREVSPLEATSSWVVDIIREAAEKPIYEELKNGFLQGEPDMGRARAFFQEVNQKIRQANLQHNVDETRGEIPPLTYFNLYSSYKQALTKAELEQDSQAAWKAYDETHKKFQDFNNEHYLPAAWNITSLLVERKFSPRIVESIETNSDASGGAPDIQNGNNTGGGAPETQTRNNTGGGVPETRDVNMNDDDDENENGVTELEELEAVVKEEWATPGSHVLYWWKKGVGTQVFVRYGSGPNATYRIRAGSSEAYDPETVPQVLQSRSEQSEAGNYITARGREKLHVETPEGRIVERWKYDRTHVQGIIGVGWKMKYDEEDEDDLEPLEAIFPRRYVTYPQTRTLIKWTDGAVTLEDRAFVRRITKGSALQGDRVIYQKALDQETRYCRAAGLPLPGTATAQAEAEEAESVDDEEDIVARGASNRRSATSEVRFAEPPAASTPSRSAGPTPSHRQSAPREDPRDAELRELRRQVDQLRRQVAKSRSPGSYPVRQVREDSGFYDGRSSVSTPEAPPRRTWEDYGRRVSVRRR